MEENKNNDNTVDEIDAIGEFPYLFFEYLSSENGNQLASRIVSIIEGLKKSTVDNNARIEEKNLEYIHKFNTRFQTLQGVVYVSVLIASSLLAYLDKFTPTIGVLFGTIVGYFFGRRPRE
ncbi:hypothetical protein LFX15_18750 [Leptospira levettii]|uniref:hypothetical protein n=1 Tax=Leptospira levettii TaxID=2023178 RepID=UPI001EECB640|nr:hypothetical protein [Leptospira levettii]MCG6150343.1 hypothetical protein [Leptospira levettii]